MPKGMLAIWSDVSSEQETDYLHWLSREHAAERVAIPGFEAGRVLRADLAEVRRYLILYELANPSVLNGADYLARLNAPTPWSSRIMPILRNFARGGGQVVAAAGAGQGGFVLPLRLGRMPTKEAAPVVEAIAAEDRLCAAWLLAVDQDRTAVKTQEKSLRSGDSSFAGLLLIEATEAGALQDAANRHAAAIAALGGEAAGAPTYATAFALRKREVSQPG
ncbi:hypothetical protein LPC08_16990 [Roseomonas sp. OT10]|uniref:DUF4286 family protein n=1 Tax=Roseomonas cutis TaxID=2897332 RepID=UPI001E54393A|nr:DUF4286 family protein [Roseomonas sp. OT10]UFN47700.1 hypothetical protein LPC08_16990 [Roseomonas sp. OT10]